MTRPICHAEIQGAVEDAEHGLVLSLPLSGWALAQHLDEHAARGEESPVVVRPWAWGRVG